MIYILRTTWVTNLGFKQPLGVFVNDIEAVRGEQINHHSMAV